MPQFDVPAAMEILYGSLAEAGWFRYTENQVAGDWCSPERTDFVEMCHSGGGIEIRVWRGLGDTDRRDVKRKTPGTLMATPYGDSLPRFTRWLQDAAAFITGVRSEHSNGKDLHQDPPARLHL